MVDDDVAGTMWQALIGGGGARGGFLDVPAHWAGPGM
jgi:hypothetical protein